MPGAGLDANGQLVRVKKASRLVHGPHLQAAFRQHFRRLLQERDWAVDPVVWRTTWNVDIQPVGSGAPAVKYLGAYVARTAISNSRLLAVDADSVTFQWQDRDHHCRQELTLPGVEFVRRYLRHVLPQGLRSVRYYGFCHPAAQAKRRRIQLLSARTAPLETSAKARASALSDAPPCPYCGGPTRFLGRLGSWPEPWPESRAPPGPRPPPVNHTSLAA